MSSSKEIPIIFAGIAVAIFMVMIVLVQLPGISITDDYAFADAPSEDVIHAKEEARRDPIPKRLMLDGSGVAVNEVPPSNARSIDPPFRSHRFGPPSQSISRTVQPSRPPSNNRVPPSNTEQEQQGNSLDDLSDEEKNRIWWEIANASNRSGQVAYSYTLNVEQARPIAERYNVSVLDVFDFFRDGVDAHWRSATAPE